MSIFHFLLMVHLIALILMVGTTLIDFINYQTFWRLFGRQNERAIGILTATAKFPKLIGIGAGLLVVTGAGMIIFTHGLMAQQLWFRIKIVFVLLLVGNNIFYGARLGIKLRKAIGSNAHDLIVRVLNLKDKLRTFHIVQLCIILIIIFLSVYKFN
ncbi:hypothetical protein MRBLMN1_002603 [Chitinophaga ginsengisegetis]|uniref:hypothetical protein n=1 Tax=Chitinophaga ginsengisegetis TaxID=393003 RepID=UPI00343673A7